MNFKKVSAFLFLLSFCPLWSETFYVLTESGDLNVRDKPENGKVIGKLKKGSKVETISENESEEKYGWKKIRLNSKTTGYVSIEFLSKLSPAILDRSDWLGSLYLDSSNKNIQVRPIAILANKKWIGVGSGEPEIKYILKSQIKSKSQYTISTNFGKILYTTILEKIGKGGCQEYTTGVSKLESKFKLSEEEMYFTSSESLSLKAVQLEENISKELESLMMEKAKSKMKELQFNNSTNTIQLDKSHILKDPTSKKNYAIARFVVRVDAMERYYGIVVAEIANNKIKNVVYSEGGILSEEVAPYGGQYHLMGGFHLQGEGLILIFQHNGFDSFINGIYKIEENKMKEIVLGGGDAC